VPERPPVSIVLPFFGGADDADAALDAFAVLERGPEDELIVADNTVEGVVRERPGVRVLPTRAKRSAYGARNEGAAAARHDWLLFLDADCRPSPALLDAYLREPIAEDVGAVAGGIVGAPEQTSFVARYVRSRQHLDQDYNVNRHPYRPMAVTANLLVRRAAWAHIGGFAQGTRSGADAEFCWRLQEHGWRLVLDQDASVEHVHRDRLEPLLRQAARDGAASAWLERRRPGSGTRPRLTRELSRAIAGIAWWTLRGERERAAFKAMDGVWVLAANLGYLAGNAPPRVAREVTVTERAPVVLEEFPVPGQPPPDGGVVLARRRPDRPDWSLAEGCVVLWAEDEGLAARALGLLRARDGVPPGWTRAEWGAVYRRTVSINEVI